MNLFLLFVCFSSLHFNHLSHVYIFIFVPVCVVRLKMHVREDGRRGVCENIYKVVRFFFFKLKSLVVLYSLDPPYKVFVIFQKKGDKNKCANNRLVTRYYSVVFFKPLIPTIIILTVLFMQLLSSSLFIGSYCVCVYII